MRAGAALISKRAVGAETYVPRQIHLPNKALPRKQKPLPGRGRGFNNGPVWIRTKDRLLRR